VSRRQQSVDVSDEVEVQRRDPHARNADPSEMSLDREEQVRLQSDGRDGPA
jgi:hypothetical protein